MTEVLQAALTAIELREAELLAWGAVGSEWRQDELLAVLGDFGDAHALRDEMVDRALVVETPSGGYRSRSAETVRILSSLRQAFRNERILQGRPLVLDYRFLQRPRRRPIRSLSADEFMAGVNELVDARSEAALRALLPPATSHFQLRSTQAILAALKTGTGSGIVVTAGTGSGKSLAFYLPLFAWLAEKTDGSAGTAALALYPRNELLKDQLSSLVGYALTLAPQGTSAAPPLSLATWFGPTPKNAYYIKQGWADGWDELSTGYLCPYLRCPTCDNDLVWPKQEFGSSVELLRCTDASCGTEIPGRVLRLTRDSARRNPAGVMLSTTESLNRQLAAPGSLRAFGVGAGGLRAVLLDEIHTYEGTTGAQNALLLRRLRAALGYEPVWAGLSATLTDAGDFFGRLVNIDPGKVRVVDPTATELEESGAEYLIALRHDPHGRAGTLSTSIQTAMAMSRCLDVMRPNPFEPAPDSGAIFGSRLFAFTDKLDSTNRLYWDLLDAEGWRWPGRAQQGQPPRTLAHLRSPTQAELTAGQKEDSTRRDIDGQNWWLAEWLGHQIDGDVQKGVGRVSSQDRGVAGDAEIIVATASLEVGFDDDRVGAVLQHKAPRDVAQFLQRKGRAGRNAATRPWTVVVLSDWGRDREAWDSYDALFSPVVPRRSLPIENLYVLRIQAVYSLLDWVAARLGYDDAGAWDDAAGPADLLGTTPKRRDEIRSRQARMADVLAALLRDGPERVSLRYHLKRSLALGSGAVADQVLDQIFWEAPRPLLASVVPSLRRRLVDQWEGERPAASDKALRTRTPLRDFVPGNLFDELLVPEVEFQVPWQGAEMRTDYLPALRALREFLPGNVSGHFGVRAANRRHWLPLPDQFSADGSRWVGVATYGATQIDEVITGGETLPLFAPTSVTLESVDQTISDASSMQPLWEFDAMQLGRGVSLPLPSGVTGIFATLRAHMHVQGGGVRVRRFVRTGEGTLWQRGRATTERVRIGVERDGSWTDAALGVEIYCDALVGKVVLPAFSPQPSPSERTAWLREQVRSSTRLPDAVSSFDRSSLGDAAEVVAARWNWSTGDPDATAFAIALWDASFRLGTTYPGDDSTLAGWLVDPDVATGLLGILLEARVGGRTPEWLTWLRRRFTLSAANALVSATTNWGSGLDADELTVDVDPEEDSTFYVSERSPGGSGHIEALARAAKEDPQRLGMAFEDALRPSDLEALDSELRAVLASGDPGLAAAISTLAASWPQGHEAARDAIAHLSDALVHLGIRVGHAARTAISMRLAGPGAHPNLLTEVGTWLAVGDNATESSGFVIEPRVVSALLAERTEVDLVLQLTSPSPAQRARAIANVLWPWGLAASGDDSYNLFASGMDASAAVVRAHWSSPVQVVEIGVWDHEAREVVHSGLRAAGEVVLRTTSADQAVLREAILDLHTVPIEVGPLLCHPNVVGVSSMDGCLDARVVLRESW